jgi:hypothetical protein
VTPDDRITAALSLAREVLEEFHSDPRSPYTLTASITRGQLTARMNRLAELERGDS